MFTILGCATMLALAAAPEPPLVLADSGAKKVTKAPTSKADPAAGLVGRVEAYYKDLQDYSAAFIQTYTRVALSKTSESRGELTLKKPGLMKWRYEKPAEKLWVVDGERLWVADPEEMQVFVDENYKTTELTTSIQFLWGEGKLTDTFNAKVGDKAKYDAPAGHGVLVLTPKKGATFSSLVLVVNEKTGEVRSSTIYETAGNKNHFEFRDVRINQGLERSAFTYTPPANFEVIYR